MLKESTIIGIVKEFENSKRRYRIGIATGNEFFIIKLNNEGRNLLYEVGNKVEATGNLGKTKDGLLRIDVTSYKVYEMGENDFEEFGEDPDYFFEANFTAVT